MGNSKSHVREIVAGSTNNDMRDLINIQLNLGYDLKQVFKFENKTYAVFIKRFAE